MRRHMAVVKQKLQKQEHAPHHLALVAGTGVTEGSKAGCLRALSDSINGHNQGRQHSGPPLGLPGPGGPQGAHRAWPEELAGHVQLGNVGPQEGPCTAGRQMLLETHTDSPIQ